MNVVITGASRGFGKAIAHQFAASGYDLFLCSRGELALYELVGEFQQAYPEISVKARPFDVGEKAGAEAFGHWVLSGGVTVDVLVNNAGRFVQGSVHNEAEGVLEELINTNLYSAYHLTRVLLPTMIAAKRGHIFNMCSIASLQAYTNGGAYSISKFALLGFSKNLREELKPHGIKVTAVCPGAAYTASWEGSGVDPNRLMEAEDVAKMVFATSQLSERAVVEDIILRPQLGDL